jgi:hypothetical protein
VLNNFVFYLKLAWFCFRLFSNLLTFLLVFLFKKINQSRLAPILIALSISLVWILNFYLVSQRSTTEINLIKIDSISNLDKKSQIAQTVRVKEINLAKKIEDYEKINKKEIKNLGLYLNLAQLNKIVENADLAKEYFDKAQLIEPQIKYLEN